MSEATAVFLDRATLGPDITLRQPTVRLRCHEQTPPALVRKRLADATVAITNKVRLDANTLAELPRLGLIAVAATGVDIVDLDACRAQGVAVCNVRDYAATSVAEHVLAVVLALRRKLFAYREAVLGGAWQRSGQFWFYNGPVRDLAHTQLGIIGTGTIARAVADRASALGMAVSHHSPSGREAVDGMVLKPLADLLAGSDVVTCHTPLTDATRGLLDAPALARLPDGAIVVNTARGAILELPALAAELAAGRLGGAAIDVAPEEPPPVDDPLMSLAARPDVIVTPHSAWASVSSRQALADQLVANIDAWLAGAPRNLVVDPRPEADCGRDGPER